jgi:hypothetical protein
MSFGASARTMMFAVCLGQAFSGCAQNTPDHLDFALRPLTFVVSSDNPQWRPAPPGGVPDMVCAGPQALSTDCCAPPDPLPPVDCEKHPLICDPWDNLCKLAFDVESRVDVNLSTEVVAVANIDGWMFSKVSLTEATTSVEGLSLLLEDSIRGVELYIGPKGLTGATSPDARMLGEVYLSKEPTPLLLSQEAQDAFSSFARAYRTPFTILLSAHLVLPGDSSTTTATATVTLASKARAYF